MANFDCVPVVIVTRQNINEILPCMLFCLKNSSFVSIDLELSGLGNRKGLNAKSIDQRYRAMVEIASTRSIISLGLSCFFETLTTADSANGKEEHSKSYQVQTFNLMCLCSEEYTVEPESLKFLVGHGFDFNRQYTSGLSYYRGSDRDVKGDDHLRQLFVELLKGRRPLVFHNGFVDLVFLYGNLYGSLPSTLAAFLADAQQMFPEGIFDTKYLAEFRERLPASYLEYAFKKRQHENLERSVSGRSHVKLAFISYPHNFPVEFCYCKVRSRPSTQALQACKFFASHGWCAKGASCDQSHNIDDILEAEALKKQRKRRRKTADKVLVPEEAQAMAEDMMETAQQENCTTTDANLTTTTDRLNGNQNTGCHRAGYDAFMTGFIFASHMVTAKDPDEETKELKNKIYLCGKDVPLLVVASNFTKPSSGHLEKFKKVFSDVGNS